MTNILSLIFVEMQIFADSSPYKINFETRIVSKRTIIAILKYSIS